MAKTVAAFLLVALFAIASVTTGQEKKDAGVVFEVYVDKSEEFRFRLKGGETTLAISGKGYKTKADVTKVIDQIKKEASKAKVVDDTKSK